MQIKTATFIKSAVEIADFPPGEEPEVAFVGRSNVGKSSLINSLLGRKDLARTSNTPGRTQLINFFSINETIRFVDLPGYGYARVAASIKREWGPMIERYLKERTALKLVVLLLDARRTPSEQDLALSAWLDLNSLPTLWVLTKTDKLSGNELARQKALISACLRPVHNRELICFSTRTGAGREHIWREIKLRLDIAAKV